MTSIEQIKDIRSYLRLNKIGDFFSAEMASGQRQTYKLVQMDQLVDLKRFEQMWLIAKDGDMKQTVWVETRWFLEHKTRWI